MSTTHSNETHTEHANAETTSLGARSNWWGEQVDGTVDTSNSPDSRSLYEDEGQGESWGIYHTFVTSRDSSKKIAFQILAHYGDASYLCGRQLKEEGTAVELSDPEFMPPWIPAAQCKHLRRYNPEKGYTNWYDGSTWVVLESLPTGQFIGAVEHWLGVDYLRLDTWELKQAVNTARSRKCDPSIDDDIEALKKVVKQVRKQADPNEDDPFEQPEDGR